MIKLINGSCADMEVDAVVNAANCYLSSGGGICGVIFKKAGIMKLTKACREYDLPLHDGDAVITPSFNMKNAKYIIHAVGPNFRDKPDAFNELYNAYYNSLVVLMKNNLTSISFPLISSGIFAGNLKKPAEESAKQCLKAYNNFINDYDYKIDVILCAYQEHQYIEAKKAFKKI